MRSLLLLFICLSFYSCALLRDPAPAPDPNILGVAPSETKLSELKQQLTKKDNIAVGSVEAEAYPLTEGLIRLQAKEKGWDETTLKLKLAEYVDARNCFQLHLGAITHELADFKLKNWPIKLVRYDEGPIKLEWLEKTQPKDLTFKEHVTYHGKEKTWWSEAVACTPVGTKVDLAQGFSIHLMNTEAYFMYASTPLELNWRFQKIQEIDGKRVKVEPEVRKRHRYRDW